MAVTRKNWFTSHVFDPANPCRSSAAGAGVAASPDLVVRPDGHRGGGVWSVCRGTAVRQWRPRLSAGRLFRVRGRGVADLALPAWAAGYGIDFGAQSRLRLLHRDRMFFHRKLVRRQSHDLAVKVSPRRRAIDAARRSTVGLEPASHACGGVRKSRESAKLVG